MPGVTLRTTFIVGFPGETEQDFAELMAFVRDTGFDHVGVFTYSHEEDTRAFVMADDVPADVKAARRDAVMELQQQIVEEKLAGRVGDRVRVLVDGPSPESDLVLTGRLDGQAPDIDALVYFDECDASAWKPGQIIDAVVIGARGYDLVVTPAT